MLSSAQNNDNDNGNDNDDEEAMIQVPMYSKTMFLDLNQVYYWRLECNTHNDYNYIIKTKWSYFN
jgi:hypothetical protein